MTYKPIVTTSVASQIADAIQQAILDGSLRANDRLPSEEDLAGQFGVSRPTMREALKRLAARHLIRSRRGAAGGAWFKSGWLLLGSGVVAGTSRNQACNDTR